MKITGKKLLAVLCTVVMLVTTIVPSLAFTASAATTTYSYTFTEKQFSANGDKTLDGVNWTLAGDGGYWGNDGTKGQQFGSSKKPYKSMTLTSASFDNVTKITIATSGASDVNASFTVSVGGEQVGSSTKITTTNTSYSFTPTTPLSGAVQFSYTQTSSKALYIKSITIEYSPSSICNHANTEEQTTPASCTTAGSTTVTCKDCGATISTETINATGHKYGDWEITKEPICEEGEQQKTCSTCGYILTEKLTAEHNYENGICTMCNEKEPTDATITFDNLSKITDSSTSKQVWEENHITVTYNKAASSTPLAEYANPARFYANTSLIIETTDNITKIVFNCASASYASALGNSIGSAANISDKTVTVTLDGTTKSFTISKLTAQVRMNSITVSSVHVCTPGEAVIENEISATITTAGSYDSVVYCTGCGTELSRTNVEIPAAFSIKCATLIYDDMIQIRYKYVGTVDGATKYGMLVFASAEDAATLDPTKAVQDKELVEYSDGRYGYTDGIAAKAMGDSQYVVGYVVLEDGTVAYTAMVEYSPRIYAQRMVDKSTSSAETKALCKALMQYGAAAQVYFNYNVDDLMNVGFESVEYDANVLGESIFSVDTTETNGFTAKSATLFFDGAITYRVKYTVNSAIADKQLYAEYTIDGIAKTGSVELVKEGDVYFAYVSGIAGKDMDEKIVIKPYYVDDNGDKVYGAELVYSGYEYSRRTIDKSSNENSIALAKAFAMYVNAVDAAIKAGK